MNRDRQTDRQTDRQIDRQTDQVWGHRPLPHLNLGCYAGFSQPEPQPGVGVEHLHNLQEGVEGSHGVASIELLEAEVVEQDVATVDTQHSEGPA